MRKSLIAVIFICLFTVACSEHISPEQYVKNGITLLEGGNSKGAIIAFKKALSENHSFPAVRYYLAKAYINQKKFDSAEEELIRVLDTYPSFLRAQKLLAQTYLSMGQGQLALDVIANYLANRKDDPAAIETAVRACLALGKYKEAKDYLNNLISGKPDDVTSQILLAEIYKSEGRIEKAKKVVSRILLDHENNRAALYMLADIQKRSNATNELINTYMKLLAMDPKDIRMMFELGVEYIRAGKLSKAEEVIAQLNRIDDSVPAGKYLAGILSFKNEKFDEAIRMLKDVTLYKGFYGAHYYLGLSYLSKGEINLASSEFQRVIEVSPENLQARLMLAVAYLKNGHHDQAIREARIVLKKDEENAYAYNILGNAYLALGDGERAINEFNNALKYDPGIADAYLKKGLFRLVSGRGEMAERDLMNAVKIAPDVQGARIILARYYFQNKRYKDAISLLQEGIRSRPGDAVLLNFVGEAYSAMKDMDMARKFFEKSIIAKPDFFPPYNNIALMEYRRGDKSAAINQYKRILEIDESNIPALLMIAHLMESEGDNEEAYKYYSRAQEQNEPAAIVSAAQFYIRIKDFDSAINAAKSLIMLLPQSDKGYYIMAQVYMAKGDIKQAIKFLKKAEALNPDSIDIKAQLGRLYALTKDKDGVESALKQLADQHPDTADSFYLQGSILELEGEKKSAVKRYRKALEISSDHIPSINNLAYLYAEGYGSVNDALRLARKAKKLAPDNGSIADTLGWVYYRMGKYDKAMEYLNEAMNYLPDEPVVRYHMGMTLMKKGNKKEASSHLEYALRFAYHNQEVNPEDVKDALRRIRNK